MRTPVRVTDEVERRMVHLGRLGRATMVFAGLAFAVPAAAQTAAPEGYTGTLNWYHQQAEAGNARAQFLLAIKYETGTDVRQNIARAADLYERAAVQGLTDAQFKFATFLETGRGRPVDMAAAEVWYRAAALRAHPSAQYNLGVMLLNRAETDDAMAEAISWLLRASRAGLTPAQDLTARISRLHPADVMTNARMLSELPLSPTAGAR
ncbi:MAG: tetratricopeptide repeat protein [Alphaproteobacteria bacterium]